MIIHNPKIRRLRRVRGKIAAKLDLPRLTVFRSNRFVWAQVIDDQKRNTLAAASSKGRTEKTKTKQSFAVGFELAKIALTRKVSRVRFDRGPYRYHGRVKALANGARQGGLIF